MKVVLELADEKGLEDFWNTWLEKKKGLDCLEKDIDRNTDIRVYSAEDLELARPMEKACDNLENLYTIIKYICQQNVARNRNFKCASDEVREGNEEHVIEYCMGDLWYKVADNLAELFSSDGVSETVPHQVNGVETSRKFKACFPENCFLLVSYYVFSDSTNKSTSCLHRGLASRSTYMIPTYEHTSFWILCQRKKA